MEAVEEPPLLTNPVEGMKVNVIYEEKEENAVASVVTDVCQTHKSNGVAESSEAEVVAPVESNTAPIEDSKSENVSVAEVNNASEVEDIEPAVPPSEPDTLKEVSVEDTAEQTNVSTQDTSTVTTELENKPVEENEKEEPSEVATIVEVENNIESSIERVTFQTEILIESVDNEIIDNVAEEATIEVNTEQDPSNLLSELGQSIELSEALRSSDVTDNLKNNNLSTRQEVFNKEELLDILEGNDEEQPENELAPNFQNVCSDKILEAQLALQQLTRLKTKSRKPRAERFSRSRKIDEKKRVIKEKIKEHVQNTTQSDLVEVKSESEGDNIVNDLVKEWDDEDATGVEKNNVLEESGNLNKSTEEIEKTQDGETKEEEISARTSIDSSNVMNKTGDEGQPQRRLGRVIKKKVIFDPDNPDTFTKSKTTKKNTEVDLEKDATTPSKKNKTEQTFQRSKSKSPMSKMQWKKPSPKNCKQNKRLTEVDKLLMDEGAVNMIYQLTPEAPKGKKNMKTKAEFIKKIQSSTPDSKEMKFRERKKESKYEDGEARKILGGKQRSSLSSSVKSPSVCEDFEAHSADDSIIYRRHSSSSYSSSCMSPRRLSDVETSGQNVPRNAQQTADVVNTQPNLEAGSNRPLPDVFMSETTEIIRPDTINKNDCLSIKEKLNSKLNLALKKRKRENSKGEKPSKLKKVTKSDENPSTTTTGTDDYKYLSVNFDQRLAEICVQRVGSKCNTEVIQELEKVLKMIESKKNISVTLLTSECGSLYSDLDLRPLFDDNIDKTAKAAYEIAESIRSLLQTVEQHSKLICSGISGRCSGIGLALTGLSDVALASESASFAISSKSHSSTLEPGIAVLTAHKLLPQPLLNDLVLFGRRLPAAEALRGGLVSRTLWPENFNKQVLNIAKDIAAQPTQNILLKKQLLNLKKNASDSTLSHLEKERDLLVDYWTSVEGQAMLRGAYNAA